MGYKVKLNIFEGPFDLLVYLIESARMSIYDINVAEITAQYISHIDEMKEMDIELSSEFIVLAAELVSIKSKMILPQMRNDGDVIEEDDPQSELVRKLIEYKKFKYISSMLEEMEEKVLLLHEKPQEDISKYTEAPDEHLKLTMEEFVTAFKNFLNKKKKEEDIETRYAKRKKQRISTEAKSKFLMKLLREKGGKSLNFVDMIGDRDDGYEVAVSFSSVLEMVKKNVVEAEQKAIFGQIHIRGTDEFYRKGEERK